MTPQPELRHGAVSSTLIAGATIQPMPTMGASAQVRCPHSHMAPTIAVGRARTRLWRTMRLVAVTIGVSALTIGSDAAAPSVAQSLTPQSHHARSQDSLKATQLGIRPLRGAIVRSYEPPAQRWLAGHRGIDIAGDIGVAIHAPAAGVVRFAGEVAGVPIVSIAHINGLVSTFQPVVAEVIVGHEVTRGQVIGSLGSGGHCAQPCLHLGVKDGDWYQNPYLALRIWPRLLPWAEPD